MSCTAGLFAIDHATGQFRAALRESKAYRTFLNLDASDVTGGIAFVASDEQQYLSDLWVFDTRAGAARQASRLNAHLARYELGTSRIIEWRGADGDPLRGALLLPPVYQPGRRVPLVVDVYGGRLGSKSRFSDGLPAFNMHILATRGFAG